MTNQIRTPFLRYLLLYYGNLAVQLRPVRLAQPLSLLNLLWNIALTGACFALATSQIAYYEQELIESIEEAQTGSAVKVSHKPLFWMITRMAFYYGFPAAYSLCLAYFYAINIFIFRSSNDLDLVTLLDSFRVELFDDSVKAKRLCLKIILSTHLNFLTVIPYFWWADALSANWLSPPKVLRLLYTYATFYVLKFCILIVIGVVMYFRFALFSSLKQVRLAFEKDKDFKLLEGRLRTLAFTSLKTRTLLAFPLLLITFIYTFDIIIEVSSLMLKNSRLDLFYQVAISGNLMIIVYYGEAINWELVELDELLKSAQTSEDQNQIQVKGKTLLSLRGSSRQGLSSEAEVLPFLLHRVLKGREVVAVYREYFQLKMFNICTGNLSFLCNSFLFILNYTVLVTQTNA